MNIFSRLGA